MSFYYLTNHPSRDLLAGTSSFQREKKKPQAHMFKTTNPEEAKANETRSVLPSLCPKDLLLEFGNSNKTLDRVQWAGR